MYQVKFTTAYKKAYKLMKKRGLDISLLDEVVGLLRQGRQLEECCRDHGLTGDLAGFRECHIKPDWLKFRYRNFSHYADFSVMPIFVDC